MKKYKDKKIVMLFSLILVSTLLLCKIDQANSQKKMQVEVYPSEIEEDNSIVAGDDFYRTNMKSMWNHINPYMGYVNNPFAANPYFPFYGMNQPVLGSQFMMNMGSQNSLSAPNPLNYNYPKVSHFTGTQYSTYPKFKQRNNNENDEDLIYTRKEKKYNDNNNSNNNSIKEKQKVKYSKKTEELALTLQEEIKKLEEITKKAQELTSGNKNKDGNNGNTEDTGHTYNTENTGNTEKNIKDVNINDSSNNSNKIDDNTKVIVNSNLRKRENLESESQKQTLNYIKDLKITKEEKERFDIHMKQIMEKLNHLK